MRLRVQGKPASAYDRRMQTLLGADAAWELEGTRVARRIKAYQLCGPAVRRLHGTHTYGPGAIWQPRVPQITKLQTTSCMHAVFVQIESALAGCRCAPVPLCLASCQYVRSLRVLSPACACAGQRAGRSRSMRRPLCCVCSRCCAPPAACTSCWSRSRRGRPSSWRTSPPAPACTGAAPLHALVLWLEQYHTMRGSVHVSKLMQMGGRLASCMHGPALLALHLFAWCHCLAWFCGLPLPVCSS